jgi:hypothetical protein
MLSVKPDPIPTASPTPTPSTSPLPQQDREPGPAPVKSHPVAGGITVQLPASETADHGHWTTSQDQSWTDPAACTVTVLVLNSTIARPVKVQLHHATFLCLLDLPREQARRVGLALLAAADYDTPDGAS